MWTSGCRTSFQLVFCSSYEGDYERDRFRNAAQGSTGGTANCQFGSVGSHPLIDGEPAVFSG